MAAKLSLILCVLAIWAFDFGYSASSHHAPAPSVDCSSLILNMADCLSFVSNGSTVSKPAGTCCSGLKTVLKTDPACLCEAFKNSAQLGVVLNITKAMNLPAACKVSAPSVTKCGLSPSGPSPAGAPAGSPAGVMSPTSGGGASAEAPASETGGPTEKAPSPSPGNTASSMAFSAASLLVGLAVYALA